MYPHIFVENITTGSTTVRCDCAHACEFKEFDINSKIEHDVKLFYSEMESEALLYKNDSTSIGMWSQQVSNCCYPIHAKPVPLFHPTIESPSPPSYTHRQSRRTNSSDIEDQSHGSELNEQKSGLEYLIEAVDLHDFTGITDLTSDAECVSVASEISQDLTHRKNETGFENLLMLAEEAVKRIVISRQERPE